MIDTAFVKNRRAYQVLSNKYVIGIIILPVFLWCAYNVFVYQWFEMSSKVQAIRQSFGARVECRIERRENFETGYIGCAHIIWSNGRVRLQTSFISVNGGYRSVILDPWDVSSVEISAPSQGQSQNVGPPANRSGDNDEVEGGNGVGYR